MLRRILPEKRDRMILLPVIGSQLIVTTSLFLMPLLIETLKVNAGLSGKAAGLLLSVELAVSAFTTLCLSAWVRKHSARHWALLGGLLTIVGTTFTLISPALPVLFATRLLAGIGAGVVGAEATSVLSRGVARERLIAIVTVISIFNAAFWLAVLPYETWALLSRCSRSTRGWDFHFSHNSHFFEVFCARHKLFPCFFNELEEYWKYAENHINVAF